MVILIIVCTLTIDRFATAGNMLNILSQVTFNAIIATGMTYVILIGGIDLSVGAVAALSGMIVSAVSYTHLRRLLRTGQSGHP